MSEAMSNWVAQPTMRQKREVDPSLTDVQLFRQLELGDLWQDASMVECYQYLRGMKRIQIPSCWDCALSEFDAQLANALDK